MAYAAVISLKQTISRLLNSPPISSLPSTSEILQLTYNNLTSLQQVLERSDIDSSSQRSRKRLNALDAQIKEVIHEIEDLLEHQVSNNFPSESENHFQRQEVDFLVETMKKNEEEYVEELENSSPEEEDDDDAAQSSNTDCDVKMVGLSKEFNHIKSKLLKGVRPDDFGIFCFIGMTGSGRSMRAKALFELINEEQSVDCGARVTIGPRYQHRQILLSILDQVKDPLCNDEYILQGDDDELLAKKLYSSLEGRKYIIFIDDIQETGVWDDVKSYLPHQNNGSLVLITTSSKEVALHSECDRIFQIPIMDEDRTWDLLCAAMFGVNSSCPQELEESGKMIVKNCGGRILSLSKAILFLLEGMTKQAFWEQVAADTEHSVFVIPDELLEVNKIMEDLQRIYPSCLGNDQRIGAIRMVWTALNSGLSFNDLEQFRRHMFPDYDMPETEFMSVFGMAGIGKTTLAKEIFKDQSILDHFDHRVWITLGPRYQSDEILVDILVHIYSDINIDKTSLRGNEALAKELCAKLSNKRCLIVLDDVWNTKELQILDKAFQKFKAKVLVTTRLAYVARFRPIYKVVVRMRLLNNEESWSLFCQKVFAQESCPFALEQAGKRISERCDGLPLLILIVANHLSIADKVEYWNKVADEKNNEIFMNAHSEISKALVSSYESLSQHLKPCFLYMGVFRQNDHDISNSRIIKLWDAEGFLEPKQSGNVEDFAASCLKELFDKSVVMVSQNSSDSDSETCRLHSVFWHLSNTEAVKNNFFQALDTIADCDTLFEGMKKQRRLCIKNSTLLGIKDVHNSIASISAARSLLCTGPPHKYPVTIDFGLRLLRVMDAHTIRLYEFPTELVELIHLRYLALTCSGELPSSISNLCSLLYLIVGQHLSIKSTEDLLLLPAEIWDMKELKHVHVTGRSLTNPQGGVVLPNLSTLLDVSAQSCTREFFEGIPNLKKLGIQIELDPDVVDVPFNCLDNVSCLGNLESLECVVVNPEFKIEVGARSTPIQMFPLGLKRLSLSGLGYPWEYMSLIGELQKLQVLELRCLAFQGATWVADEGSFKEVQFLLLEDMDLVRWEMGRFAFKNLDVLSIKHCYQLQKLPRNFSSTVYKIEVVDCNMFAMKWAEEVKEEDLNNTHISRAFLEAEAHASWYDAKKLN